MVKVGNIVYYRIDSSINFESANIYLFVKQKNIFFFFFIGTTSVNNIVSETWQDKLYKNS